MANFKLARQTLRIQNVYLASGLEGCSERILALRIQKSFQVAYGSRQSNFVVRRALINGRLPSCAVVSVFIANIDDMA